MKRQILVIITAADKEERVSRADVEKSGSLSPSGLARQRLRRSDEQPGVVAVAFERRGAEHGLRDVGVASDEGSDRALAQLAVDPPEPPCLLGREPALVARADLVAAPRVAAEDVGDAADVRVLPGCGHDLTDEAATDARDDRLLRLRIRHRATVAIVCLHHPRTARMHDSVSSCAMIRRRLAPTP